MYIFIESVESISRDGLDNPYDHVNVKILRASNFMKLYIALMHTHMKHNDTQTCICKYHMENRKGMTLSML